MATAADWAYSTIAPPHDPYPFPLAPQHPYIPAPFQHLAAQRSPHASPATRPQKILCVIGTLGPGGAELQLCHSAIGLAQRGYKVRVAICYSLQGSSSFYLPTLQNAGIEVVLAGQAHPDAALRQTFTQIPHISHIIHECPKWLRPMAIDLLAEMLYDPPDLVHAWLDLANIAAAAAALAARIPRIVLATRSLNPTHQLTPQDSRWYHPWYRFLAGVPGIQWLSNSQAGARDYAAWLDLDPQRFAVIRNGLDFTTLRRADEPAIQQFRQSLGLIPQNNLSNPAQIVAGIFRLNTVKQPLLFVDVVEQVMRRLPHLHAVIAGGPGGMEEAVHQRVATSPFAQRFHLLGARHDIPLIISAADVVLQTSRLESSPNSLLEAQALGCPVVTTEAYGAIEAVSPNHTAFVSRQATPDDLANHLHNLLTNQDLRHRFADAAPIFVRQRFGLARMLDETAALYQAP